MKASVEMPTTSITSSNENGMFIYLPRNSANYNAPIITQRDSPITNDTPSGWSRNGGRGTSRSLWLVRSPLVTTLNVFRLFWNGNVCNFAKFALCCASVHPSVRWRETSCCLPSAHEDTAGKRLFQDSQLGLTNLPGGGIWMLFPCAVFSRSCRVSLTRDTCPHCHLWRSTGNR